LSDGAEKRVRFLMLGDVLAHFRRDRGRLLLEEELPRDLD
jgi:hypothetical protein